MPRKKYRRPVQQTASASPNEASRAQVHVCSSSTYKKKHDPDVEQASSMMNEQVNKPVECIICQDEIQTNEKKTFLKCAHEFHDACIREWLIHRKTCPICRTIVDANDVNENTSDSEKDSGRGKRDQNPVRQINNRRRRQPNQHPRWQTFQHLEQDITSAGGFRQINNQRRVQSSQHPREQINQHTVITNTGLNSHSQQPRGQTYQHMGQGTMSAGGTQFSISPEDVHNLSSSANLISNNVQQRDWIRPAIFACVCCFWPTASIAICCAILAKKAAARGDGEASTAYLMCTKILLLLSVLIGITLITSVLYIVFIG